MELTPLPLLKKSVTTMIRLKTSLSIALSLSLVPITVMANPIAPNQGKTSLEDSFKMAQYKPPGNLGKPPTTGGGTRGNLKCTQDAGLPNPQPPLTPIMPLLAPNVGAVALTISEHPEFFVYVPQTSATEAEFILKDEEDNDVYRTNLALSGEPGIVSVSLPEDLPSLEVGKNYRWFFAVICDPDNRIEELVVDGWTQRQELDTDLAAKLERTTRASDRSFVYAQNGIWHDALSTLAQEIRNSNRNSLAMVQWKLLLESAGLNKITEVPLLLSVSDATGAAE
jgi:hypothetical protein